MKNYRKKIIITLTIFGMLFSTCYSQNSETNKNEKPTVLVLLPFDKQANGGFSPEIQAILEEKLINNSEISLIKFPLKKLMNVPYQNIYDKKYCKPILEKINPEFIIMTKLELESHLVSEKKWNLNFRIYDVKNNIQFESKLKGEKLTRKQIEKKIGINYEILIVEIKKH